MTWFSPWLSAHEDMLRLWFGVFCTLGLYSILYKENKLYRFFEHVFLGLATGYLIAITWNEVLLPKWWEPIYDKGQWTWIFATVVGLCFYLIYSQKLEWIARLVIGFWLGVASGQGFQGFANDVWPQIAPSFKPLIPHAAVSHAGKVVAPALNWPDAINNLLFLIILFCVMSYFFFSFEQKHSVLKNTAQAGRWMLMFAFGAIFGSTIMGRLALLIDRMDFLMNDFGGKFGAYGPAMVFWVLMALVALVLFLVTRPGAREDEPGEEPG